MTPCQHCGAPHPPGTPNCPRTGESLAVPGVIGTRIDRYQIESLLGAGGFGAVYRAKHVHTESMVALKVLKRALGADPGMVERFLREARAAAAVGSDHIVRVLDAGHGQDGTPFLALELLEGIDMQGLALEQGRLPPMRVVLLCLQVLDGLEAAHRKGIVHRDMKPANAFVVRKVDERGTDKDFVKLLDFGISKMHAETGSGLTMTGMAMGTPSYMAPEQFFDARSVDARADVYSVAVMMYELLAGRLPIESTSYADLIVKVKTEAPPHLAQVAPSVAKPLADAVMVGLAKEKEQRWPSAREFASALRAAMGLPLPGNTPIPPLASSAALPRPPLSDSDSMISGKTAAPRPATPAPAPARPVAPLPPMPIVPGAPTPAVPAAAVAPTPAPANPAWVTPAPRPDLAMKPAPQSGSALKWVLIIGGVTSAMCCLCVGIGAALDAQSKHDEPQPAGPEPVGVTGSPSPPAEAPLDPNGHDIFDSLKLDPKSTATGQSLDGVDTVLETFEVPSRSDLESLASGSGMPPGQVKKLIALTDRLRKLQQLRKSRPLSTKELREAEAAMQALEEL